MRVAHFATLPGPACKRGPLQYRDDSDRIYQRREEDEQCSYSSKAPMMVDGDDNGDDSSDVV